MQHMVAIKLSHGRARNIGCRLCKLSVFCKVSGLPELLNLTQKLLPSYETYVIP